MVRRLFPVFGLVLALAGTPVRSAPRPPVELQRSDKWHVNWADDRCTLTGAFGQGDSMLFLKFAQFSPDDDFMLQVFGRAIRNGSTVSAEVDVDFGPESNAHKQLAMFGTARDLGFMDLGKVRLDDRQSSNDPDATPLPALGPDFYAQVQTFTFGPVRGKRYRLNMGPMGGAIKALGECTADMVRQWGYDPAVEASLLRRTTPIASTGAWLRSSDYPSGMLMTGQSATIHYRLDLDETGKVIGCHVAEITKAEGFVAITCRALSSRARFLPALDAKGAPVKSFFAGLVRWIMGPN